MPESVQTFADNAPRGNFPALSLSYPRPRSPRAPGLTCNHRWTAGKDSTAYAIAGTIADTWVRAAKEVTP